MKKGALFFVIGLALGFTAGWTIHYSVVAGDARQKETKKLVHQAVLAGAEDGMESMWRDRVFERNSRFRFTPQQRLCLLYQYGENLEGILRADVIREYGILYLRRHVAGETAANLLLVMRGKEEVICEYRQFENLISAIPWGPGSVTIRSSFHLSNPFQIGMKVIEQLSAAGLNEEHIGAKRGEVRRRMAAVVRPLIPQLVQQALQGNLAAHQNLSYYRDYLSAKDLGLSKTKLRALDRALGRAIERWDREHKSKI